MRLATLLNSGIRGIDIEKTLFLSPQKIVYSSLREFELHNFEGAVIGGDWDRLEKRFEDLDVYGAFKQVHLEGKDWRETVYYQRILDALNKGEILWGCANENDLQQRCKNLDELFQTIKKEGYKTQHSLLRSQHFVDLIAIGDEVTVNVGRDGDLLFSNGAHRLAIAKLLGIKQIPVKIAVRHREWAALIVGLLQYAKTLGGELYQPATHPDLTDIPASHRCEDRFLMIRDNISAMKGRLLDIGANLGYFCHRFEEEGFECYAIEELAKELYFLRKLRRAENRRFKIVGESIFNWSQVGAIYFDVVLALNVFHHALKTKESYYKLVALLQNLQMGELFFEVAGEHETQMEGAYRNYSPSEFADFVMRVSTLKHAEIIGKASDGRTIYRLSQ
jgi:2-polyprenyl-3-methyl-5-hydroxy-6-metoxy-1,4-benzoquinol methylase